jgi:two-component system sensor histidine kinase VicK
VSEKAFFLSFASHEIRSPLVSIAWALEYIAKQKNAPPVFLERATTSIHTILDTIEEVMEMQKTEQLSVSVTKRQSVQIHGLIYKIIDSMYLASKEHDVTISDTTSEANKLFVAQVDPRLFERVLATLLYNAIKHSPTNGIVEVALTQSDKNWQIRVHNDGEHISEEDQRHIFVDYSKTTMAKDKRYKGVGFGLLLAYEIITAHGGELSVESQENEGVTLLINMPKRTVGKVIKA